MDPDDRTGTDSEEPDGSANAVAAARDDWQESTTALQRVRQVVERTTTPKTAAEIAEESLVSEPTARKHLQTLVEIGTATAMERADATRYSRDEDRMLYRRIRELAADHSRDELMERVRQMGERLTELEAEYDAASPEALATSLDGDAPDGAWEAVSEWQTTERNLHVTRAAINFGRARDLDRATH